MLWIWKTSCTRFALTWSNSTTLQKNALSHEQTSKNKTRKEKDEAGECHTCWGLLWLWGIPQGH
jgi:predicted GIY-YIG superfamily endonuclease